MVLEHVGFSVSLVSVGAVVVAAASGRLARGRGASWASVLVPSWSALVGVGLLLGLGLSGADAGVLSLVHAWVALGLSLLCVRTAASDAARPRRASAWALLSPLPPAVLTLGLWLPSLPPGRPPSGVVVGFSGGSVGSVSLSVMLLVAQAVLLVGVVGFREGTASAAGSERRWDLRWLGGTLGRAVSVGWLALAVWPDLLPVLGAVGAVAATLAESRPRRRASPEGGPLSSVTLRSFLQANRRMGAELRAIEAEVIHAAAETPGTGTAHTPTLLRRLRGAHALTARLSQVSREDPGPRTLDSLSAIVDRAARRVDNPNQLELRIRSRGPAEPGLVDADGVELALAALLQNAVDAQDAVGVEAPVELEIDTQVPLPSGAQHLEEAVRVRVVDSGSGLTEEERAACFEPFFTTREGREGLGLSVVGALVRVGDAVVELAPRTEETGTCASLWLRWTRPTASGSLQWTGTQPTGGGADVLVVAADAKRRELLSLMLAERGVTVASSADWRGEGEGGMLAPRPWGLVVFPDAAEQHDALALVRWLSGLYAFVVAPPELATQLAATGLPEGRMQRAVTDRAEGVVQVVLKSLAETRGAHAPGGLQSGGERGV